MSGMDEGVVSVGELAEICGLGEKQIQNLAKEGVVVKAGRGEYRLKESLRGFIRYRTQKENEAGIDLDEEEAREARAKREIAETKAALMKGRVVETEAVMMVAGEVLTLVRNRLLSLPDRLIPEIVPQDEVLGAKKRADGMIREILCELVIGGDEIRERTDFKRVTAPIKAADVEFSAAAGEDHAE